MIFPPDPYFIASPFYRIIDQVQISRQLVAELARAEIWIPWAQRGIRVFVILSIAWVLTRLLRRLLNQLRDYAIQIIQRRREGSTFGIEQRATTIVTILRKLSSTVIWLIALVMALTELTFNIEPLLAGFGVAGLALGLGAQALIKDWLAGLLMIFEDQIRIGDSVVINGLSGSVEELNLRTTVLRAESGAVHIISNGAIGTLSNMTREYSYYVFETTLAHRADADRALQILETTAKEIASESAFQPMVLAPIEVMGVERLTERGAVIRARIKTLVSQQAPVGRELNRRVKARLDAEGIPFPPPPPPV